MSVTKAVVLAAGRGTRMQKPVEGAVLDPAQSAAADAGLKGLIPFHGHPYLAYVLSALADAGIREVCLVVAPGENPLRRHFEALETTRVQIRFAVQQEPLGSAHAMLAAEEFAGDDPVVVINADNYYPAEVVRPLLGETGHATAAFDRGVLTRLGNIPPERVAAYALLRVAGDGSLAEIVEKPDAANIERLGPDARVSMTCWRFDPSIFEACRAVPRSRRGEFELPDAVLRLCEQGESIRVVPVDGAVLDLSSRGDVASVGEWLAGVEVRL